MRSIIVAVVLLMLMGTASAENEFGWVMCQPDSEVNIRSGPGKRYDVVCHAYMGDRLALDGRKSGKWVHCIVPCENGEGWIREDFLSTDPPEDLGSGFCETSVNNVWARYSINGKRRKKLKAGSRLEVYITTAGWSVTSQGFVMTKFLIEVPSESEDSG